MAEKTNKQSSAQQALDSLQRNRPVRLAEFLEDVKPFQEIATITELSNAYHVDAGTIWYWLDRNVFYWERPAREYWISRRSFDRWFSKHFGVEPLYKDGV